MSLSRQLSGLQRTSTRSLFNFKKAAKKLEQVNKKKTDDEAFHHEYSIRPDTYAFKVDATNEKTRSLTNATKASTESAPGFKPHPLQKLENPDDFKTFNLVEFIYRYSTNYPFGTQSPQEVFSKFPQTTLHKLARFRTRPKRAKMLVLGFIEDLLYNPNYGYFSKEVEIFHSEKPFDYNNIENIDAFLDNWQKAYAKYDETKPRVNQFNQFTELAAQSKTTSAQSLKFVKRALEVERQDQQVVKLGAGRSKRSLQLWHTPTELFNPYYGEALARYLLYNYKTNGAYPYEDLVIYEMGAGNGTLMCNILNYIKRTAPDIYARTQYRIIEISSQLAEKQLTHALKNKLVGQGLDAQKLSIENISIFDWKKVIEQPCFFIALEVFDNFAHDLVRYDNETGEPYEGQVLVDEHGDFYEFYTPQLSYYTNALLNLRENSSLSQLRATNTWRGRLDTTALMIPFVNKDHIHPLAMSSTMLGWKNSLMPFKDNLTPGEFVPTRLLRFFQILKHKFPRHSLICSDFNKLPNTIPGYYNAPVVQTVLQDRMIDVLTYMVMQGYFDIMFATDFGLAQNLYQEVCGKPAEIRSHKEFLSDWANTEETMTKQGENPMLDFYTNVLFMCS